MEVPRTFQRSQQPPPSRAGLFSVPSIPSQQEHLCLMEIFYCHFKKSQDPFLACHHKNKSVKSSQIFSPHSSATMPSSLLQNWRVPVVIITQWSTTTTGWTRVERQSSLRLMRMSRIQLRTSSMTFYHLPVTTTSFNALFSVHEDVRVVKCYRHSPKHVENSLTITCWQSLNWTRWTSVASWIYIKFSSPQTYHSNHGDGHQYL